MRFIIHAEDRANSLELRKATRPNHLEYMSQFDILVGGPMLDANGDACGSAVIIEAESLAAAQEFSANDPYAKAGLFERVAIHEFVTVLWPTPEG